MSRCEAVWRRRGVAWLSMRSGCVRVELLSRSARAVARRAERDGEGFGVLRDGVEAEGDFGDDAEGAEGAGHEFVEVVAGDVLDDFAAGAGDGAVGEDDGHADDEVAEAAVLQAEGAGVVGGDDAADGGAVGPEGIERDELVVLGEDALHRGPGAAGGDGAGEVLPGVLADAGEAAWCRGGCLRWTGLPQCVWCRRRVGVTASVVLVGVAEDCGDLFGVCGETTMTACFVRSVFGAGDGLQDIGDVRG